MCSVAEYLADQSASEFAHCHNFYDWFCTDGALARKQRILDAKVRKLVKSSKIDVDKTYVWYKNNCPVVGGLYDDIRFSDMNTHSMIWTIVPRYSRTGQAEVWGAENNYQKPILVGTWKEALAFFGVK